jgi:NADH dehydrogenase
LTRTSFTAETQTKCVGQDSSVDNRTGFIWGKSFFIKGALLVSWTSRSTVFITHRRTLHGSSKVALDTTARMLAPRTEPRVELR